MSEVANEIRPGPPVADADVGVERITAGLDPTDRPIPFIPEGALVLAAGVTLLIVGLRHRAYIVRKVQECQRWFDEFQRQGGLDDLAQVARQTADVLKSPDRAS